MSFLKNEKIVFFLYVLIAILISLQVFLLNKYNNFTIFQHAVFHFFEHKNLYLEYPKEYSDVFLYNPSFTIFFIPFAYFPTFIGILLWAIVTTLIFFFSVKSLPLSLNNKLFIFYLIIPELVTTLGNLQTNLLIVSFTVLTMTLLEKNKFKNAAALPALNFFIKGYGGVAGIFFILKDQSMRKYFYVIVWFVVLGLLPLVFYNIEDFVQLYQQWFFSLKQDYNANTGISIMGIIKSVFYENISVVFIQLIGIGLFMITVIFILYRNNYAAVKLDFLAYVLIWMIIFNQSAESPTYIIASTGVFIWFVSNPKTKLSLCLFCFFYVLTVLSPSDLFPKYIRVHYVVPYSLKALPCVLVWLLLQIKLLSAKANSLTMTPP